jgi:hypothetical protein
MKSPAKKLTDDEIEAEVLATRDDPTAWKPMAFVPPSRSPRRAPLKAAQECRLGLQTGHGEAEPN